MSPSSMAEDASKPTATQPEVGAERVKDTFSPLNSQVRSTPSLDMPVVRVSWPFAAGGCESLEPDPPQAAGINITITVAKKHSLGKFLMVLLSVTVSKSAEPFRVNGNLLDIQYLYYCLCVYYEKGDIVFPLMGFGGIDMKTALILCSLLTAVSVAQFWQELTVEGFTLRWATVSGNELAVELSGPTTGWVAVGFDPMVAMQDANIIIGYVASGVPYIRDDFGVGSTSHAADTLLGGSHDLAVDGGSENAGVTEIMFNIPLDSGDPYDKPLNTGSTYTVILARSADGQDSFSAPHAVAVTEQIEIIGLSLEEDSWGGMKSTVSDY
jgi:hypothetical protein